MQTTTTNERKGNVKSNRKFVNHRLIDLCFHL